MIYFLHEILIYKKFLPVNLTEMTTCKEVCRNNLDKNE